MSKQRQGKLPQVPRAIRTNIPLTMAVLLCMSFFAIGSASFRGFFSLQVVFNQLIDNAYLLIAALGGTMVLILGGIDLSIGAVIAFCNMITCHMLTNLGVPLILVVPVVLGIGVLFGLMHGYLITYKEFQPFIATLAGQFIARGACYIISVDTIIVNNPTLIRLSIFKLRFQQGGAFLSVGAVAALLIVVIFQIFMKYTQLGRNIYAVGGSEQSANLMGLPVKRTKMWAYTIAGLMNAIASFAFTLYVLSAYGTHADGLHLDAVAAAVIGGTLTTGGVGLMVGTLFGVLTQSIIRTMITFQGTLNSWWAKIVTALLLLMFILIQRGIIVMRNRNR